MPKRKAPIATGTPAGATAPPNSAEKRAAGERGREKQRPRREHEELRPHRPRAAALEQRAVRGGEAKRGLVERQSDGEPQPRERDHADSVRGARPAEKDDERR